MSAWVHGKTLFHNRAPEAKAQSPTVNAHCDWRTCCWWVSDDRRVVNLTLTFD